MKQRRSLLERVITAADLDAELQPKLPLIEIAGEKRVLIENHLSVVQYSREQITIKVSYGCVQVKGKRLELAKLSREQLVITGCIDCVALSRGREVK